MRSILIIDDNKHIRTQINLVLKLEGYQTYMAANGLEGVTIARDTVPSLIICDIMMPQLDGYGVLQRLRDNSVTADIPFLFLSAKAEKQDIREGMNLGADDYLWKPFSTEDLIKAIEARLERYETTRRTISSKIQTTPASLSLAELTLSRDRFLSLMTHDLKSAFTGVIGLAELIATKREQMPQEEFDETLHLMTETVQSTYGLLDSFLEWSRLQLGGMIAEPEYFNVYESALRAAHVLTANASHKKITIRVVIPDDCTVFADMRMVDAILRNLLYNALKFTHMGGSITLGAQGEGNMVEISVQDTGIGISEEDIVRLLQPGNVFTTLGTFGEKGTGLGIIFCRELAEKNGGTLRIKSSKDQGSTFTFTLPRHELALS